MKFVVNLFGWFVSSGVAFGQPVSLPAAPAGVLTFTRQNIQFSRVNPGRVEPLSVPGTVNRPFGGGTWDFGLARTELTQGQWIEMVNAFNTAPVPSGQTWTDSVTSVLRGDGWVGTGMYGDHVGPQGRFVWGVLPSAANIPAMGIGWYGAAMYCNWLHNGRATTFDALNTGAYDLRGWDSLNPSTWPGVTREPGAQYWIPSYDEWAVASFYGLNRHGEGLPGWWPYLNGRERLPVPGAPGVGETSAGWIYDLGNPLGALDLPIASYPNSQSPWGLLDTSGSAREWVEGSMPGEYDRLNVGTRAGAWDALALARLEQPGWVGADSPTGGAFISIRLATTTIPSPSMFAVLAITGVFVPRRR